MHAQCNPISALKNATSEISVPEIRRQEKVGMHVRCARQGGSIGYGKEMGRSVNVRVLGNVVIFQVGSSGCVSSMSHHASSRSLMSFVNVSTIKWSDRVPCPLSAAHRPKSSEVCHIATTESVQTATGSAGVWVRHRGTRNES